MTYFSLLDFPVNSFDDGGTSYNCFQRVGCLQSHGSQADLSGNCFPFELPFSYVQMPVGSAVYLYEHLYHNIIIMTVFISWLYSIT